MNGWEIVWNKEMSKWIYDCMAGCGLCVYALCMHVHIHACIYV